MHVADVDRHLHRRPVVAAEHVQVDARILVAREPDVADLSLLAGPLERLVYSQLRLQPDRGHLEDVFLEGGTHV